MDVEELDAKLSEHISKSRQQVLERVEKYGLQSQAYADETVDMCNFVLDSMDAFRTDIIKYLKELK